MSNRHFLLAALAALATALLLIHDSHRKSANPPQPRPSAPPQSRPTGSDRPDDAERNTRLPDPGIPSDPAVLSHGFAKSSSSNISRLTP